MNTILKKITWFLGLLGVTLVIGSLLSAHWPMFTAERPPHVQRYLWKYKYLSIELNQEMGIPIALTLAVAGLESDWGRSELAVRANNHFGIKSKEWPGPIFCKTTQEYMARQQFYTDDCFRKYPLIRHSYFDFGKHLKQSPTYSKLFYYPEWDYYNWAWGLQMNNYATDPFYAKKLIRMIEMYGLDEF